MSQFTESQMVTVRAAVEFLVETQRANHGHVAADVQEVFDLFNPVFEAPVEAPVEEVVDAEEKPAKAKKAK